MTPIRGQSLPILVRSLRLVQVLGLLFLESVGSFGVPPRKTKNGRLYGLSLRVLPQEYLILRRSFMQTAMRFLLRLSLDALDLVACTLRPSIFTFISISLKLKLFPFPPRIVKIILSKLLLVAADLLLILTHQALLTFFVGHLDLNFL
jgi:hypothetical protein